MLYADREFPSHEFLDFLINDQRYCQSYLELLFPDKFVNAITPYQTKDKRTFGNRLYISARLNLKNEFVFLVSNVKLADPFATYKKRWNIELMFGKFKTLGFNLESTHITNPARLSAIMLLIGIAYTACCIIGEFFDSHIKPIKTKSLIRMELPKSNGFNTVNSKSVLNC